jgi:hypothetical protein
VPRMVLSRRWASAYTRHTEAYGVAVTDRCGATQYLYKAVQAVRQVSERDAFVFTKTCQVLRVTTAIRSDVVAVVETLAALSTLGTLPCRTHRKPETDIRGAAPVRMRMLLPLCMSVRVNAMVCACVYTQRTCMRSMRSFTVPTLHATTTPLQKPRYPPARAHSHTHTHTRTRALPPTHSLSLSL